MKKLIVIILSAFCLSALFTWFSCNPFDSQKQASRNESSILDELDGTRLTISCPIDVNGSTWDGGGMTVNADAGYTDGSQSEHPHPIFLVTNGTVKNVTIGPPAHDGIELKGGNCSAENVTIPDAGGAAVRVTKPGTYIVSNCTANNAEDKVIQINDLCDITTMNINVNRATKFIRQNGGKTWKMTSYCNNCTLTGLTECVFRSDSTASTFFYRNLTTNCTTIGYPAYTTAGGNFPATVTAPY